MKSNLPSKKERKAISDLMPKNWNTSDESMEAINTVLNMSNQVTDTYANLPIICRGRRCPYFDTCELVGVGKDVEQFVGQRCPIEIAKVIRKTQGYFTTLEIDETNMVDVGLVKEIVDNEMILERIAKKQAANPDLTEDVVTSFNERTGEVYTRQEVKQIFELKREAQKRIDHAITLLNSTRKDKAELNKGKMTDPLTYIADLMAKAEELTKQKENTVDAEYNIVDGET